MRNSNGQAPTTGMHLGTHNKRTLSSLDACCMHARCCQTAPAVLRHPHPPRVLCWHRPWWQSGPTGSHPLPRPPASGAAPCRVRCPPGCRGRCAPACGTGGPGRAAWRERGTGRGAAEHNGLRRQADSKPLTYARNVRRSMLVASCGALSAQQAPVSRHGGGARLQRASAQSAQQLQIPQTAPASHSI